MLRFSGLLLVMLLLVSCKSKETGNSDDVNPEAVYFDYQVWGSEEDSVVTVRLQYRIGGEEGATILLQHPAGVTLDGKTIPADSSAFLGAYYEVIKRADEFGGRHRIVFTDLNEKQYAEEFDYPVFYLKNEFPTAIGRKDLKIELNGLRAGDKVKIILSDTSFFSHGIEKVDSVTDGMILISKEELIDLLNGPINMEIIRDEDRYLSEAPPEGGRLSISYGLKREFMLED